MLASRSAVLRVSPRTALPVRPKRDRMIIRQCRAAALPIHALAVPKEYGFVMASVAFAAGVAQWLAIRVMKARKLANVPYPKMVADGDSQEAVIFNCTQRSHHNMLETLAPATALTMLLGLQYPVTAAAMFAVWSIGRILYALGYSKGDPSKRAPGAAVSSLTYLALIIANLVTGLRLAL